jgi:two-component system phosphate regulon response regulator PhoB
MRKVLVADDDDHFRELVTTIVREAGYDVAAAHDGQEGWEAIERGGIDMAVLDLNMPRLTGMELTKRIRTDKKTCEMPILMLTVRSLVEDQVAGFERGADDYLTKPFDAGMLAARLRALERRILS